MTVPVFGFAPDAAWGNPGNLTDCSAMLPYENGLEAAPAWVSVGANALAAECQGAQLVYKLDGSARLFAGTATKLYELSGTTWTDRSRAGNYTSSVNRWSICQFGDTSLAANYVDVIQTSTAGAFADQATAPKAKILVPALASGGGFVIAFNTNDGTYGISPDRWWCCAVNDATSWTISTATQANTGRLLGFQGAITAAINLTGDSVLACKAGSIYVGRYAGPPVVWSFQEIQGVGCVGQEAIVNIGGAAFFVGDDGFFIFDGSSVQSVGDGIVRTWWTQNSNPLYRYRTIVQYDQPTRRITIRFCSAGNTTGIPNSSVVFNTVSKRFGRDDISMEAGVQYVTPATSWDSLTGTWDSLTNSWDSTSWAAGTQTRGGFNTSHTLITASGTPTTSTITTGVMGDDNIVSRQNEARVRYETSPTGASIAANAYMQSAGLSGSADSRAAYDAPSSSLHKFPLRVSGRWHRDTFTFTGSTKVTGVDMDLIPAGKR